MSRHLENLNRLMRKLRDRYGDEDEIVQQLQAEIEICQAKEKERLEKLSALGDRRHTRVKGPCSGISSRLSRRLEQSF